jgi:hypothetical protein
VRGALLVLLLFAVPTLATLAKDSWYLPQSNPSHYLNIANKMQVPHCPVILKKAPSRVFVKIVPMLQPVRTARERDSVAATPSIGVTVSLQHRSPPFLFL